MSKKINWESNYKSPMRGKVTGRGAAYTSRKEQVKNAYQALQKAEKANEEFKIIEPLLKSALLEHMVKRLPITVEGPLYYFAEELKKAQEDEDEIDRAYYNRSRESESISTFQIVRKAIEPGTVLTFKRTNEAFGQWIFKSDSGEEIEIYNTPTVHVPGVGGTQVVQNPGFWGLLMATNIYREVMESMNTEEA